MNEIEPLIDWPARALKAEAERDEAIRTLKNSTVLMGSYLDRARKAASYETRLGNLGKERDEWKSEYFRRHKEAGDLAEMLGATTTRVEKLRAALGVIVCLRLAIPRSLPPVTNSFPLRMVEIARTALEADKPTRVEES